MNLVILVWFMISCEVNGKCDQEGCPFHRNRCLDDRTLAPSLGQVIDTCVFACQRQCVASTEHQITRGPPVNWKRQPITSRSKTLNRDQAFRVALIKLQNLRRWIVFES